MRAQSSFRLFCSGVPVSRSRKGTVMRASAAASWLDSFLRRWPSSMQIVWNRNDSVKKASSDRMVS
jgi:hypothetical protein